MEHRGLLINHSTNSHANSGRLLSHAYPPDRLANYHTVQVIQSESGSLGDGICCTLRWCCFMFFRSSSAAASASAGRLLPSYLALNCASRLLTRKLYASFMSTSGEWANAGHCLLLKTASICSNGRSNIVPSQRLSKAKPTLHACTIFTAIPAVYNHDGHKG